MIFLAVCGLLLLLCYCGGVVFCFFNLFSLKKKMILIVVDFIVAIIID